MSTLTPKDHAEAVALFRSEIIGALTRRELDRGELAQAFDELSQKRFRPPGAKSTKTFSVATLERWYYAYKTGGLEALRPAPRSDRGRCRELTAEQRQLLAAVREEHPSASVPVILRTLLAAGRLDEGAISASSVRRLYQEQGLDRVSLRQGHTGRSKVRLRGQAERPGALWHADVCHGAAILIQGKSQPTPGSARPSATCSSAGTGSPCFYECPAHRWRTTFASERSSAPSSTARIRSSIEACVALASATSSWALSTPPPSAAPIPSTTSSLCSSTPKRSVRLLPSGCPGTTAKLVLASSAGQRSPPSQKRALLRQHRNLVPRRPTARRRCRETLSR